MLSIPLALLMVILQLAFADERAATHAAEEFCPGTRVVRVEGEARFGCRGLDYVVRCDEGDCVVRRRTPPRALHSAPPREQG